MLRQLRKGQSTAEYAIVIGLVLAAVVGMQIYVKRGIQAKFKDASDMNVTYNGTVPSNTYGVNTYLQYEPQYSEAPKMVTTRNATEIVSVSKGGAVNKSINGTEVTTRTGLQKILDVSETDK